jgi:hypothetical protein
MMIDYLALKNRLNWLEQEVDIFYENYMEIEIPPLLREIERFRKEMSYYEE